MFHSKAFKLHETYRFETDMRSEQNSFFYDLSCPEDQFEHFSDLSGDATDPIWRVLTYSAESLVELP